jgi:hypothetical protein
MKSREDSGNRKEEKSMTSEWSLAAHYGSAPRAVRVFTAILILVGLAGWSAYADSRDNNKQTASVTSQNAAPRATAFPASKSALLPSSSTASLKTNLLSVPLNFEPNQGQTDPQVQFMSRGSGYLLFLTPGEVVLNLEKQNPSQGMGKIPEGASVETLRMKLIGANVNAATAGLDPQPGVVSYIIGNDPQKWHTGIRTYGKVNYTQIYPGIDLVFYGNQRQLEYDFVVTPGADPSRIVWQIDGASAAINADGNLVLTAANGPASFKKPLLYQMDGDKKIAIEGSFAVAGNRVGFRLGSYNRAKALIIDPVLSYASYLGGSNVDNIGATQGFGASGTDSQSQGLAVDSVGSIYVTGYTQSTDFPTQVPYEPYKAKSTGATGPWAFVTKFSPNGSSLVYSTYLGGSNQDYASAIAVDSSGAYVTGWTNSPDFPVTAGAYQTICEPEPYNGNEVTDCALNGPTSAFLTKLNASGTSLAYSTFLGGLGNSSGWAVAVDSAGRAYLAGNEQIYCYDEPNSNPYPYTCFPTTSGAVIAGTAANGHSPQYAFAAVFDPAGANLLYSTIYGDENGVEPICTPPTGSTCPAGTTYGNGITVDPNGNFYLIGSTNAGFLPTTAGVIQPTSGPLNNEGFINGFRGYVAKFNPVTSTSGASLAYGTYLGGPTTPGTVDYAGGIIADSSGNSYITGVSQSPDFPVTQGAYQKVLGTSGWSAFVTKLNSTGSAIKWSTFLGGNGAQVQEAGSIQMDGNGDLYILGRAQNRLSVPWVNPVESNSTGNTEPFVAEIDPTGSQLLFSTPVAGDGTYAQGPGGLAVDALGNIYFAGNTFNGGGLYITPGSFQQNFGGGGGDGYVAVIAAHGTASVALTPAPSPVQFGATVTLTAVITSTAQYGSVPTGTVSFQNGSTVLGTGALDGTGTASYDTSSLAPGNYTLTAVYSGDNTYASVSGTAQLTVNATDSAPTILPSAAAFGNQTVNTSAQIAVKVTNAGTDPLVITSVSPASAFDFTQTNNCATTLAVNASCTVTIAFKPASLTTESAPFTITDNAGTQTIQATGTGVNAPAPQATLSSTSLTFTAQPTKTTSAAQTVTLTNSGTAALTITSIAATGDFAETSTCGSSLAATANCSISVTFTPTAAGSRTGTLTITDNASSSIQSVTLSGTGSTVAVSSTSASLAVPSQGSSTTATIQLTPSGGFAGTLNLTCSVAYLGAGTPRDLPTCGLNPSQATISGSSAISTTLTVSTTAARASVRPRNDGRQLGALFALLFLGVVPLRRRQGMALLMLLCIISAGIMLGCGGGSTPTGTTTGSYSVTVTATSGKFTSAVTIPLTVQ